MVAFGPGQQVEHDVFGVGDFAPASGVVQITAQAGEGGQTEAGINDASAQLRGSWDYPDRGLGMDRTGWTRSGLDWDGGDFVEIPLISAHFRSFE